MVLEFLGAVNYLPQNLLIKLRSVYFWSRKWVVLPGFKSQDCVPSK